MNAASILSLPFPRPAISILGVRFDNVTIADTLDQIESMIASRQPHYAVTANVDFVVQAQTDVELRRIFFEAHLVLCDGTPLVWASRLLGNALPERVAGADVVPLLIQLAAKKKYRLFFLGAAPQSIERAMAKLKAQYPELVIAGFYSPPFNQLLEMDHEEIRRQVLEARPDVLFVSLGCPKQEKWVAMHYRSLAVPVTIGVGATIDFLAGQVRRAPVWMQRGGLEWIFRLSQEPRRLFGRYSKDLWVFGLRISAQLWRLKHWSRAKIQPPRPAQPPFTSLPASLDHATVKELAASMEELVCRGSDGFLDLSGVNFIDSTGVAMLMRLQNRLKAAGQHLILIASSPAVKRVLSFMRLQEFFDSAPDHDAAQVLIRSRARETAESVVLEVQHTFRALIWHGEVTAANVEDIWDRTQAHIEKASILQGQSGQPAVANPQVSGAESSALVIDLSAVRFIDSSGLGLMVRAKKCANQLGLTLRFTNPQLAVQNVIRLARLEKFLLAEEQPGVSVLAQFRRPPPQNAPPKPSPVPAEICSP